MIFDHNANNIHAMCGSTIPAEPRAPKVIVPTVGRKIWLWPSGAHRLAYERDLAAGIQHPEKQPIDASICYTHSDHCINVHFADFVGNPSANCSVRLIQPGEAWDESTGKHCSWMPYQAGQAAKTEAAERQVAQLRVADIGVDANGSPVTEGEQLSRDLTEAARDEAVGG